MKVEKLLGTDVRLTKNPDVPQILIYHTHASETYADYGPQNPDASVAGAGSYLAELLRQRGWNVIHDTTAYDRKEGKLERSRAYTYALEGVQGILQEHPTIEVILDLHRDGVRIPCGWYRKFRGNPRQRSCSFRE
jgi:stage II sporulation protein P